MRPERRRWFLEGGRAESEKAGHRMQALTILVDKAGEGVNEKRRRKRGERTAPGVGPFPGCLVDRLKVCIYLHYARFFQLYFTISRQQTKKAHAVLAVCPGQPTLRLLGNPGAKGGWWVGPRAQELRGGLRQVLSAPLTPCPASREVAGAQGGPVPSWRSWQRLPGGTVALSSAFVRSCSVSSFLRGLCFIVI